MSASDEKPPTKSRQRTRVKQIHPGDNLDELFDENGQSKYDILIVDHDKVTDIDAMLRYCKSIVERSLLCGPLLEPMIIAYYSRGIDRSNLPKTVERYSKFGIFTCDEKSPEAQADLESAIRKEWADRDAEHEAHMRSLHPEVAAQEGQACAPPLT